jgi:hypothetical protein
MAEGDVTNNDAADSTAGGGGRSARRQIAKKNLRTPTMSRPNSALIADVMT